MARPRTLHTLALPFLYFLIIRSKRPIHAPAFRRLRTLRSFTDPSAFPAVDGWLSAPLLPQQIQPFL